MTIRDPYTGVERRAAPRPRSFTERWWPVAVIVAILLLAGFFEWQHATSGRAPRPQGASPTASTASPPATVTRPAAPAAVPPPAPADELAQATAALTKAADQLASDSELMLGIAALQAIVLAGQLYLFGLQRRATRNKAEDRA